MAARCGVVTLAWQLSEAESKVGLEPVAGMLKGHAASLLSVLESAAAEIVTNASQGAILGIMVDLLVLFSPAALQVRTLHPYACMYELLSSLLHDVLHRAVSRGEICARLQWKPVQTCCSSCGELQKPSSCSLLGQALLRGVRILHIPRASWRKNCCCRMG